MDGRRIQGDIRKELYMSDEEYTYPFALWLVKCKGVPIEVNDTGHF